MTVDGFAGKTRPELIRTHQLSQTELAKILSLAQVAADADGTTALSEHALLQLQHGVQSSVTHIMIHIDDQILGYAHIDTSDLAEGPVAELVVHPMHRHRGLGRQLVQATITAATDRDPAGRLRLWAHGDHPSANALAISLGFVGTRTLWQMRRPLTAPIPTPQLPSGIRIRAFHPGDDDQRWITVNSRAFAHHPEQGRWTLDSLRTRLAEPWFDPAGFLLAERGDELLGFHWTKIHDRIGEVYVLGVDPAAHGTGLGTALTLAGLTYLRDRGLTQAMLYVDGSDVIATGLYQKLGFLRWSTDVCFRRLR